MYEHICSKCNHRWFDHRFKSRCPECTETENITTYED